MCVLYIKNKIIYLKQIKVAVYLILSLWELEVEQRLLQVILLFQHWNHVDMFLMSEFIHTANVSMQFCIQLVVFTVLFSIPFNVTSDDNDMNRIYLIKQKYFIGTIL